MKIKAALFDFDGVLVDTERLYDIFWADMGKRHHIPDPNFSKAIKGSTLEGIINKYFADRSEEEKRQIMDESDSYDVNMDFPPMPGSLEFVRMLKQHQVPVALVTSSGDAKLSQAFKQLPIKDLFDTIVSADRITRGKPDPFCYLLAAKDLGYDPADCLVFEDSFTGIASGKNAGMNVIALSTTNPAEELKDKAYKVIPDFQGLTFDDYLKFCL